ncbi:MAG: hypothetical protein ACODAD_07745, partial [Planctomycetota bacterium]
MGERMATYLNPVETRDLKTQKCRIQQPITEPGPHSQEFPGKKATESFSQGVLGPITKPGPFLEPQGVLKAEFKFSDGLLVVQRQFGQKTRSILTRSVS